MTPKLRAAQAPDADTLGHILYQFQHQHDWMPELYTLDDCVHFCATMITRGWVTVVCLGHDVRGFMARDGAEICALYLAGRSTGRGIGKALIDHAKAAEARLWLRCAEANSNACRFYRRQGFVEAARSEGAANEENIPDILYVWPREVLA